MRVNFYATFRQIVGQKAVEINTHEGMTVQQLVDRIVETYPAMQRELLDDQGRLFGHVHVIVNGRDFPFLEQAEDTVLNQEDKVSFFPAVGGG